MIGMDLNPILKAYLVSDGYNDIEIFPINAYRESKAPFITWLEFNSVGSDETFWMQQSTLTYSVYDTDMSRAKDIAIGIQKFFNLGDDVSNLKDSITSAAPEFRICWVRLSSGGMFPPEERDGFSSITRSFEVGYVEV